MNFLVKNKFELLLLLLILVVYFALRLPNLTLQPIFADEAIYIRWAQIMRAEPTLRFVSLSDGKTPLFMWAMIPFFKILSDPLMAGRLLSVLSGFLTLMGVFAIGWKFLGRRVGFWGAFLVAITPFMVFFDRMALVDSMLAAFSIWSLFFALLLIETNRIDVAMMLGYLLGGSMLTKTPGFFNIMVLPVTLLTFKWENKNRVNRLLKLFGLWVIAIGFALAIYNILRLGPGFTNLSSRNQDYVHSPARLLEYPLDPFIPHFNDVKEWFINLLGPVMLFIAIGAVLFKKNRKVWVIILWSIIPLMIQMALLKTFTARYILSSIPPLLLIGALGIEWVTGRVGKKIIPVVLVGLVIQPLIFSLTLLQDPSQVWLPKNERRGYLQDWTAGYGLKEIAAILTEESKKESIVVGTEGFFGTLPDGLWIYLDKTPNITIVGGSAVISAQLREAALEHPTYFVANKSRFPVAQMDMVLIKEYPKASEPGRPQDAILLFQIYPPKK